MSGGPAVIGPLIVYGAGFALSLVAMAGSRPRSAPFVAAIALVVVAAVWAIASAARAGPLAGLLAGAVVVAGIVAGGFLWLMAGAALAAHETARLFDRVRPKLEPLAVQPAAEIADLQLHEAGIRSFEREGSRAWFAQSLSNDNGRTPDLLSGFLFAPDGPPELGHVLPRSPGYHHDRARPFRLTALRLLAGPHWWSYTATEVWEEQT
jgi:hypothetical protein